MRVRIEMWTKEQGGRHTPVFDKYRPDFRASTEGHGDVDLGKAEVGLPEGTAMLMPGMTLDVELTPVDEAAWADVVTTLVLGVLEDGRQVGTATVLER